MIAALPARPSLSDDVYEAIKALIMNHAIAPGSRLSIDQLARDLAVSPTPIREALARLESDGLAVKEPAGLLHDTGAHPRGSRRVVRAAWRARAVARRTRGHPSHT